MKRLTVTLLTTLLMPLTGAVYAQGSVSVPATGTTSSTPIPSQGANVSPGVTPTQGTVVDPGVSTSQGANSVNAQQAQSNAIQANPSQTREQATGGGVFGPSAGPGIFGPASQTVTTDIYGNQQPAAGTSVQPTGAIVVQPAGSVNQPTTSSQGIQNRGSQRPGQAANPTVYDASGNPVPSNNLYQNQLPRDLNPITPNSAQPAQTAPSGSVTGR